MGFKVRNAMSHAVAMVRKRPGMYIGDTDDGHGLHQLLWEVVANSLDEHWAGHGELIEIVIHADGSFSVSDQGRGISIAKENGRPFAESICVDLHTTATRDGHRSHIHIGPFGVGLMPVNALSERFRVDIFREGAHWRQAFRHGVLSQPLARVRASHRHGTTIHLKPDSSIFRKTDLSYERIRDRLNELAALLPTVKFRLRDEQRYKDSIARPEGIVALVAMPTYSEESLHGVALVQPPIVIRRETETCFVEAAFTWRTHGTKIDSFVNLARTREGGSHVDGLLAGLRDSWRHLLRCSANGAPVTGAAIDVGVARRADDRRIVRIDETGGTTGARHDDRVATHFGRSLVAQEFDSAARARALAANLEVPNFNVVLAAGWNREHINVPSRASCQRIGLIGAN